MTAEPDPTDLVSGAGKGVASRLFPLVYDELRSIAHARCRAEGDVLLQPTAIVHEVYLRLRGQEHLAIQDRNHFLALAARTLRQVLVDHARARQAAKRGGNFQRISLTTHVNPPELPEIELLALHEALSELAQVHKRRAEVVELRFFGGLSLEETAALLGVSPRTVGEDWNIARAFLFRRLTGREP